MKQEYLQIGDWVFFKTNNVNAKITEIYSTLDADAVKMVSLCEHGRRYRVLMDEIEDIPLTNDFLEKTGFVRDDHYSAGQYDVCYKFPVGLPVLLHLVKYESDDYYHLENAHCLHIKTVADLQHLIKLMDIKIGIQL